MTEAETQKGSNLVDALQHDKTGTKGDIFAIMARQRAEHTWTYAVRAWDRRSGLAQCVTIPAIAPWTDARSWLLTFAIAEVNAVTVAAGGFDFLFYCQ